MASTRLVASVSAAPVVAHLGALWRIDQPWVAFVQESSSSALNVPLPHRPTLVYSVTCRRRIPGQLIFRTGGAQPSRTRSSQYTPSVFLYGVPPDSRRNFSFHSAKYIEPPSDS